MKNAINNQFKMNPGSKEVDTEGTFKNNAAVLNMGHPSNYGTPSEPLNKLDTKEKKDEFGNPIPKDFKSDIKGETGGTADSYETLEKKIVKAAKDDPSSGRASSSTSLRQTSRGNTQTSGMTQAERDRVEQKVSGIQSASSKSGAVQTYERLKNLRRKRQANSKK